MFRRQSYDGVGLSICLRRKIYGPGLVILSAYATSMPPVLLLPLPKADALKRRANALERRVVDLDWLADALDQRVDALEWGLDVLGRQVDSNSVNTPQVPTVLSLVKLGAVQGYAFRIAFDSAAEETSLNKDREAKMVVSSGGSHTERRLHQMMLEDCEKRDEIIQKIREEFANEESGLSAESACQATIQMVKTVVESKLKMHGGHQIVNADEGSSQVKKQKPAKKQIKVDWDNLRLDTEIKQKRDKTADTMDSLDYEAVMNADVHEVADAIKERGMHNTLAGRIKGLKLEPCTTNKIGLLSDGAQAC
ncbi:hypothetical protein Tco_1221657 [Tanacetum coccineum]